MGPKHMLSYSWGTVEALGQIRFYPNFIYVMVYFVEIGSVQNMCPLVFSYVDT